MSDTGTKISAASVKAGDNLRIGTANGPKIVTVHKVERGTGLYSGHIFIYFGPRKKTPFRPEDMLLKVESVPWTHYGSR